MSRRFISIWFPHLISDWFIISNPSLRETSFVVSTSVHGRMIITSASLPAMKEGIHEGMVLADARALLPSLVVFDEKPGLNEKLLKLLALWCIRFTPSASIDLPDALVLDVSGCSHLWGGERSYLNEIIKRIEKRGYHVRAAMADTIGAAWALARYGSEFSIAPTGTHSKAILPLPAPSLRIDAETTEKLYKLGLHSIQDFLSIPRSSLRRRFGAQLLKRIDQATGAEEENIEPILPAEPFTERLPCLEPISTATGIQIAMERLLEMLCRRLHQEQKGLRTAIFKGYRVDGTISQLVVDTTSASSNADHLLKMFLIKLPMMQPENGIELFTLEAKRLEPLQPQQEKIWEGSAQNQETIIGEFIDCITSRIGTGTVYRYLPSEHHWPERSVRTAQSLSEKPSSYWKSDRARPLQLLKKPDRIEVTAPIPDYPPMLFRYRGKLHKIIRADGPERIEQEWWIQEGEHRDYYQVEDEQGGRYWLFRSGHYDTSSFQWFIHGFFA